MAQRLEDSFEEFNIEHSLRSDNHFAYTLATLGSKIRFEGATTNVTTVKRPIPVVQILKEEFFDQLLGQTDWQSPHKEALLSLDEKDHLKELKDYALMAGDLYKKLPGGVLARCLNPGESTKRLKEVHEKSCDASSSVSLYRHLWQLGYYWPEISEQATTVQEQCTSYQYAFDQMELYAALTISDWRIPFLEYFIEGILPDNYEEAYHLRKLATRYFVE
nr:hypothetical protein CFP56_40362 [Quercus suber]